MSELSIGRQALLEEEDSDLLSSVSIGKAEFNLGMAYRAIFADIDAKAKMLVEIMMKNRLNDIKNLEEYKVFFDSYDNFAEMMETIRSSVRGFGDRPLFDAMVQTVVQGIKEKVLSKVPKGILQSPNFQLGFGIVEERTFNKVLSSGNSRYIPTPKPEDFDSEKDYSKKSGLRRYRRMHNE